MPVQKFKLVELVQETPEVKTFRFEPLDKFSFQAGQFVVLNYQGEKRAYSISSHPSERFVDLTIRIGPESYFPKKLEQLKIGDIVEIDGPHGTFTLDPETKSAVFIGAGVGIAGLKSLWTELSRKKGRMAILYSARTESEIIWRKDFEKIDAKIVISLTREKPAVWSGELGRIDAALIMRNVKDVLGNHYYICGPPEMVSATQEALLKLGIDEKHVKAESWGGIGGTV